MQPKIILGSQSPRRKSILSFFNIPFEQKIPNIDERAMPITSPDQYVLSLSQAKSEKLSEFQNEYVVITADTVVYCNGEIFNKPVDLDDAIQMLKKLSGVEHSVFTGMTISHKNKSFSGVQETKLTFHDISDKDLVKYIESFNAMNKCGAYTIMDGASIIVKDIKGCAYNVQGLPLNTLNELLKKHDIHLWDYLIAIE